MGNVPGSEAAEQDFEEGEKGIVIGTRHDENSNPSSPSSQQGQPAFRAGDSIADVAVEDLEFTEVPTPPDGGYGWVIVFASFLCNMIVDGIAYSFGIFMPTFADYFGEGLGKVAWVGSLLNGVYLSAGPIVSGLTNLYGCRPVTIAGAIFAGVAFLISTTVSSVSWLMIVYGVMGGFGFGLIYLPAIVTVNYYFESRRALATGIAVCGSGVGTFVFAPFASYLLSTYGWKGANMILAGVIFNGVVCGALMRPLVYKKPKDTQKPLLQMMAEEKQRQMKRDSVSDNYFFVKLPDGTLERRPKWKLNADPGVHSSLALNEYGASPGGLPTIAEAARTNGSSSPDNSAGSEPDRDRKQPQEKQEQQKQQDDNKQQQEKQLGDQKQQQENKPGEQEQQQKQQPSAGRQEDQKDADNDSEKASDEEKNDVVPELPSGEERELGRRGSKRIVPKRRTSVPAGSSVTDSPAAHLTVNGAAGMPAASAPVTIPKNVSTPAFDHKRRGSGVRAAGLRLSASGSNLNPDLRRLSFQNRRPGAAPTSQEELWLCSNTNMSQSSRTGSRGSIPRPGEMLRPMSRRDIFYSGSIYHLAQYQSQRSLASYRASVLSLPRDTDHGTGQDPDSWACVLPPGCGVLAEMIDMSLLRNPLFLLICVSNVFGMLGFYVPFVYIVDSATQKGIDRDSAAFLLSVIGITNTLGRVISGFITDFPRVNALFVNNVCLVLSGVCILLIPFCYTYTSYIVLCIVFGFFVAAFISLTSVVLVDLLGLDSLVSAFGLVCISRGLAAIVGSPLAGALYDYTGEYNISFYAAGGLLLLAGGVSFLVPCAQRRLLAREQQKQQLQQLPSSPSPPELIVSSDEQDATSPVSAV